MSLDRRSTLMLRCGRPGSGKTWSLVRYLVDEFIPDHAGVIHTNLPLNVPAIVKYCVRRYGKGTDAEKAAYGDKVATRIKLIPSDVEQSWLAGHSFPGDYFAGLETSDAVTLGYDSLEQAHEDPSFVGPLKQALVVIDEAGKMWPNRMEGGKKERKDQTFEMTRWCRTIRHDGARLILICQDEKQLDASLRRLVDVELHTTNLAVRREPITGALLGDWFQLKAKFTGRYITWCQEREIVSDGLEMSEEHAYARPMATKYFELYNSHNREDGTTGGEETLEYLRFGWFRFLWWLWRRNWPAWSLRLVFLLAVYAVVCPPFSLAFRLMKFIRTDGVAFIKGAKADLSKPPGEAGQGGKASPAIVGASASPEGATLLKQLQDERALRSELEQRLGASSSVVLVDSKSVVTEDGDTWYVGKYIEFGAYAGQLVAEVDPARGRVQLANGVRLRLRRLSDSPAPGQAGPPSPHLDSPVQPSGAGKPVAPIPGPPAGVWGGSIDLPLPGNAGVGPGAISDAGNGSHDSVRPNPPVPAPDARSAPTAPSDGIGNSGKAP